MIPLSQRRTDNKRLMDSSSTGTQLPPRVSINANQFTLIDSAGNSMMVPNLPDGPALDVIIVDRNEHQSKLFWGGKKYNPAETVPPVCFSDNGVAPSSMAQEPQSPTCAGCPHNVIGSAISPVSGKRIKACGDLKKFAVVVRQFPGVYQFQIKPGSFKSWENFRSHLAMQKLDGGSTPDLCDVVIRIRFTGQGVMSFEPIEFPEGTFADKAIEVWERNKQQDITGLLVGRFDVPAQGVLPGPRQSFEHMDPTAPRQVPPPAPPPPAQAPFALSGQNPQGPLFPKAPVAPSAPAQAEEPKARKGKAQKKDEPAAIQPAPPVSGIQAPQGSAPPDVASRLEALFKLPTAK